jgi:uncharacterized protein (DUF302 family)
MPTTTIDIDDEGGREVRVWLHARADHKVCRSHLRIGAPILLRHPGLLRALIDGAPAAIAERYRVVSQPAFQRRGARVQSAARTARSDIHPAREPQPKERSMIRPFAQLGMAVALATALTFSWAKVAGADELDGVVRVKSAYGMEETIARIKRDIAGKGIMFFDEIRQSELAAKAGVKLNPSTLLIFGNPPLGTLFLTSNPDSGLDWPVRLLVRKDDKGDVWAVYTDFAWIARRHNIKDRDVQFNMATSVVQSITASVKAK